MRFREFGRRLWFTWILALLPLFLCAAPQQPSGALDRAFDAFWKAEGVSERLEASAKIQSTDPGFEEVYRRLGAGRSFSSDVKTGTIEARRKGLRGKRHPYVFLVPEGYDPTKKHAVHVFLHGGVSRRDAKRKKGWWERYEKYQDPEAISVFPVSWSESLWWQESQVENLRGILDALKRDYNLDEDRIFMFGVSDGATGAYFHALRDATLWAGFLPFIGHPGVLENPSVKADGDLFAGNTANRPLFIVNTENDRLYPARRVLPYVELFRKVGASVTFHRKQGGHDTRWWASERKNVEAFLAAETRVPLPDRIQWETETTDRYQRFGWLVIEELGTVAGEADMVDHNELETMPPPPVLGVATGTSPLDGVAVREVDARSLAERAGILAGDVILAVDRVQTPTAEALGRALYGALERAGYGTKVPLELHRSGERVTVSFPLPEEPKPQVSAAFPRSAHAGRVELERRGNEITVSTRGVTRYRLLLSPAQFDLDLPIKVFTNGDLSFEGKLERSVETLLSWASRDLDRSMLFGAELSIQLKDR